MRVTHVITRLIVGGAQENTIASVLGLVGAGGIGQYVQDAINTYKYSDIGMALLIVIVITMGIDFTSAYVRAKIL